MNRIADPGFNHDHIEGVVPGNDPEPQNPQDQNGFRRRIKPIAITIGNNPACMSALDSLEMSLAGANVITGNLWGKIVLGCATAAFCVIPTTAHLAKRWDPDEANNQRYNTCNALAMWPITSFFIFASVFTGDNKDYQIAATCLSAIALTISVVKLGVNINHHIREQGQVRNLEDERNEPQARVAELEGQARNAEIERRGLQTRIEELERNLPNLNNVRNQFAPRPDPVNQGEVEVTRLEAEIRKIKDELENTKAQLNQQHTDQLTHRPEGVEDSNKLESLKIDERLATDESITSKSASSINTALPFPIPKPFPITNIEFLSKELSIQIQINLAALYQENQNEPKEAADCYKQALVDSKELGQIKGIRYQKY